MHQSANPITETTLNVNLSEFAHTLIRELAMAAKKVAIYGCGHPVATKSLGKPTMHFGRIFNLKKYVNINLHKNDLYVLNIFLQESVFTKEIIKFMQLQDIKAILFEESMTNNDFAVFVDRFVQRINVTDSKHQIGNYLKEKNVRTIEINTEKAFEIFESHRQYRGDVDGDFSVRNFAMEQLGFDLNALADVHQNGMEALNKYNIDFNWDIIEYILPEKITSLNSAQIKNELHSMSDKKSEIEKTPESTSDLRYSDEVLKLLSTHPDRDKIFESLNINYINSCNYSVDQKEDKTRTNDIKIQSHEYFEHLLDGYLNNDEAILLSDFASAFSRLLKTGQQELATTKINKLIDQLNHANGAIRQKALGVLLSCLNELNFKTDFVVFENALNILIHKFNTHEETYEYSELAWQLFEIILSNDRFDLGAKLTASFSKRKHNERDVVIYDTMAIKQIYGNLNRKEVLSGLISKLLKADFNTSADIRAILINIGSEETAFALTNIISHHERSVRQQALKILSELGKSALKVCSQILVDDSLFTRDSDRHELPDNSWYIIRNAIYIIGLLKDMEGVLPFRLRITDSDIRVRREIIIGLEKIGGEDACDLLFLMIDDPIKEIRERALITISLIGDADHAPLLVDAAVRNPSISILAITALGKLGGEEAINFLEKVLNDDQMLSNLSAGQVSKEELKLAVIKSLGNIGNPEAISKLKEYNDNLSTTQKIFFKKSQVNKAISNLLDKK